MKRTDLTDWFDPNEKPYHIGVYETRGAGGFVRYQHWDGEMWGFSSSTPKEANRNRKEISAHQNRHWRGLITNMSEYFANSRRL
jgi:hypothetical protein